MQISSSTNSQAVQQNSAAQANSKARAAYQDMRPKDDLNAGIVATMDVNISAGKDAQGLVWRAALDKINELLAGETGENVLQKAADEQDNSAEATAKRILDGATAFYDAYAKQHPDKDPETLAKDFTELVRGGFEKGFNEAKDILKGLKVLEGDVESGIQKTYDLVSKGFDDFLKSKLDALKQDKEKTPETAQAA